MNESKILFGFVHAKSRTNDDEVSGMRDDQLTLKCDELKKGKGIIFLESARPKT